MDKYESLKLKNQLCFPIYLCSKEIIKKYTPYLDSINLTYTQYIVMLYMWEVKSTNVSDLGKVLLLDSSTLSPLLKKLEIKGYLSRKRLKEDERNLEITLTSEGEGLKDKALDIPTKMGKCINLSDKEIITLYNLMYKILLNVEEDNNDNRNK